MPPKSRAVWIREKEALLGRLARRSKNPLEFIKHVLSFVLSEVGSESGILYLADEAAPALASLQNADLDIQPQLELVATASQGITSDTNIKQHIFLSSKSIEKAQEEVKLQLAPINNQVLDTILFFSDSLNVSGLIVFYCNSRSKKERHLKQKLKPVLSETTIMLDFVIDRFLQRELIKLNRFGLEAVNFDTNEGMSRLVDEVRKFIGCEGVSFFVRDTSTDDGMFWLAASSPKSMPTTPVGYCSTDNNLTGRALVLKRATVIHNVDEVRRRIKFFNKAKWCDLHPGNREHTMLFTPVVRNGNVAALLRCTNKTEEVSQKLFNRLDTRRAGAFVELLHTWQSAIDNEVRLTSSLLDIAHELGTSSAGIKARAEFVDGALKEKNYDQTKVSKVLNDIGVSVDAVLEMMDFLMYVQTEPDTSTVRSGNKSFKPYADLCVPTVNSFRNQASERGLQFRFVKEHELGSIYADIKPFVQIMQNIIGNAVKYTQLNREIVIVFEGALPHSRYVAIRVASESLPIRPEEREYIFRFRYRAESARGTNFPGHGRGLAIARARARRFKGDIVHNYAGSMNVFSLLLPRTLLRPVSNEL